MKHNKNLFVFKGNCILIQDGGSRWITKARGGFISLQIGLARRPCACIPAVVGHTCTR